ALIENLNLERVQQEELIQPVPEVVQPEECQPYEQGYQGRQAETEYEQNPYANILANFDAIEPAYARQQLRQRLSAYVLAKQKWEANKADNEAATAFASLLKALAGNSFVVLYAKQERQALDRFKKGYEGTAEQK